MSTSKIVNSNSLPYFDKADYLKTDEDLAKLDPDKLTPLLKPRYINTLHDAMSDLGGAVLVQQAFVGMQRYLYS